MRRWDELVTFGHDRVRGFIYTNRHLHTDSEREDAYLLAMHKLTQKMIHTFQGTDEDAWYSSAWKLVDFACLDVQAKAIKNREREVPLEGYDTEGKATGKGAGAFGDMQEWERGNGRRGRSRRLSAEPSLPQMGAAATEREAPPGDRARPSKVAASRRSRRSSG